MSTVLLDKVHEEILVNNKNNASPLPMHHYLLMDGKIHQIIQTM